MTDFDSDYVLAEQIKLIRMYLKLKIMEDNISFRGHTAERNHVYDLMKRTICQGESHSAVLTGPKGCGKTTLINSVLHQLSKEVDLASDVIIVKLNGLVHCDDKTALKSITAQMQLENAVGDRVFGTFAENLAFLLSCLQSGADRRCKSMVFVLGKFDIFCHGGLNQTLLYNLFDITHNKRAPMCVVGITNRLDVMELLEKRVKSRFSQRHIFIFPYEVTSQAERDRPLENCLDTLEKLLCVPAVSVENKQRRKGKKSVIQTKMDTDQDIDYSIPQEVLQRCKVNCHQFERFDPVFVDTWNDHIRCLVEDQTVIEALEKFCYYSWNERTLRNLLFQIVCKLRITSPYINANVLSTTIDNMVDCEHRVKQLQSLSVLELSLVIAMTHAANIFDNEPINFEMVLHRYTQFANTNSSTQTVPRPVILKAFEHLHTLELILPVRNDSNNDITTSKIQKEYKLYYLAVPIQDIKEAVKTYKALPTEIKHWFDNSIVS